MNRKALGRGLGALIPEAEENAGGVREIPVEEIEKNREQPRTRFNEETLRELADSVRTHGIVQPVVVRLLAKGGYGLIAGERRLRAARMAGLETVPAVVREVDESGALELALVENLQREDLNPIDEARGYEALMEVTGVTQEEVAERVGKDRSTVANAVRLLDLPRDDVGSELEVTPRYVLPHHASAVLVGLLAHGIPEGILREQPHERVRDGLWIPEGDENAPAIRECLLGVEVRC